MGFFITLSDYFESKNLCRSRAETKRLLFNNDPTIPDTGGVMNRISRDEFPGGSFENLIPYYENELYQIVNNLGSQNMRAFYLALENGMCALLDGNIPRRLRNSTDVARKLRNYFHTLSEMPENQSGTREYFACALYTAIYFIANGYICQWYTETINGLQYDREEFTNEVMVKFGCSGKPGVYAIYNLADRDPPNSVALYEAGELEYYGKGFSQGVPNYANAYSYYKKAVEGTVYNPLAGWSLGYILYYYHNTDKKDNELLNASIPCIDTIDAEYRKILAITHLTRSFDCGCPAAANVLAAIVEDNSIPSIYKEGLKPAVKYLQVASDAGYVYAKNILANRYFKRASAVTGIRKERLKQVACQYLKQSADLGEPWAMNKYARILHEQNQIEQAYRYFKRAARAQFEFSALNLLEKYYLPALEQGEAYIYNDKISQELIKNLRILCGNSKDEKLLTDIAVLEKKYGDIFSQL